MSACTTPRRAVARMEAARQRARVFRVGGSAGKGGDTVWLTDWSTNAIVRFDPLKRDIRELSSDRDRANVRQMLGRAGEAWGAESGPIGS